MAIKKGYWPCCDGFDNIKSLIKCDKEELFQSEICSPSGNCECKLVASSGSKPRTSCNSSCVCRYGNTGRFCSKCITGYYKRGGTCVRCPKFLENFPVVTTVCFLACILISVVLLTCFKSYKRLSLVVMLFLGTTLTVLHFKSIIPGWFFMLIFLCGSWV